MTDAGRDAGINDPLVGAWTFSGRQSAGTTITLTVNPDKTFYWLQRNAPPFSCNAGSTCPLCFMTNAFSASYVESVADDRNELTWTFLHGTKGVVVDCTPASLEMAGTPMTTEDVDPYITKGLVPPTSVIYAVTQSEVVFYAIVADTQPSAMVTFTKVAK